MSYLEPQDHGPTYALLIGLIALVFIGIIMSLVIEARTAASAAAVESDLLGERLEERIARLVAERDQLESRFDTIRPRLDHPDRFTELSAHLASLRERRAGLEADRAGVRHSLAEIERLRQDYRWKYHRHIRSEWIGRKFHSLSAANGRTYSEVTISGEDDVGLRIRHSTGTTRIRYADLPAEWREDLQWSPLMGP